MMPKRVEMAGDVRQHPGYCQRCAYCCKAGTCIILYAYHDESISGRACALASYYDSPNEHDGLQGAAGLSHWPVRALSSVVGLWLELQRCSDTISLMQRKWWVGRNMSFTFTSLRIYKTSHLTSLAAFLTSDGIFTFTCTTSQHRLHQPPLHLFSKPFRRACQEPTTLDPDLDPRKYLFPFSS